MGRPNFNFQKRQKEIAKKKKQEEKKQRKLENKAALSSGDQGPPIEGEVAAEAAEAEQREGDVEQGETDAVAPVA